MAAPEVASPDTNVSIVGSPCPETVKEGSLDNVMEKLRAKSSQFKSWAEMSKSLRIAIAEKKHLMTAGERTQLQRVLDTLQKSIKVTSLQSMVERLDSITRQQGLKFTLGSPNTECYIFSDMFYVEIVLETTGAIKDVKIAHQEDPVTCPELVKVLRAGNFPEFTKHLEGLASIYQLNTDKKQKTKAYLALQALEVDLSMLAQLQSSIVEPSNLVHKSHVGILQQRRGGYSLKLTYFISPYDLLDVETKASIPLTVDTVIEKGLGHSVTVCIESSTAHKLQTTSLITVSKTPEGKSHPSFAALSNLNSTTLPANFVLKLPKPIPMATGLIKKINNVTNGKISEYADLSAAQPLLSVIINDTSNGKLSAGDQGLYVTLPDQHHCYFLNSSPDLEGVMVSSIPFTHPAHVPQILVFLRQQMLFNTVISSCVRPSSKKDAESPFMFEVMAYSASHILVSFEHPLEESLATVDLDLRDITNVKCKIYTLSSDATMCTDEYASKIMQRSLSIPITMRSVIRKAQGQQQLLRSSNQGDMYCASVNNSGSVPYLSHLPNYGNSLTNGSSFSGGDFSNLASRMCNKPADGAESASFPKNGSGGTNSDSQNFSHQSNANNTDNVNSSKDPVASPSNASNNSDSFSANFDRSKNSNTSTSNQNGTSNSNTQFQKRHANTMLMNMLSDVPSANPSSSSFPFLGQSENNSVLNVKSRKRKKKSDARSPGSSTGRSPKRKMSEEDCRSTPDVEMCDSPIGFDASSMPASLPSSSDAMNRNVGSVESFIKTEPPSPGFPHRSASTDSYLLHEEFQSRQMSNVSDSSRMSEGSTPNSDVLRNYINFEKDFLASSESNYGDQTTGGEMDCSVESTFNVESNQTKFSTEKQQKKKKSKEKSDNVESSELMVKAHDSSDESSMGEASQKSFGEQDSSQVENLSVKSSPSHNPQPIFTSLKIAKSGDGHKVSKSEMKIKQKEGKRSSSSGDGGESSGKRKSDTKKERKRKRIEGSESSSGRSPVRSLHVNLDASLMPPPSSSSETSTIVSSSDMQQPIRPITLNVKNSPVVTCSSNFQSKSPLHSKKSSSLSSTGSNSSKSSTSKGGSSEKSVKPSPPRSSTKISSSDSESKKSSSGVKIPSKHKQSSSGKSSTSGNSGSSSGRSSPSKTKSATLKLKNYGFPPTVTLAPLVTKTTISPPTSTHNASNLTTSDPIIMQATVGNLGSPKSGSNSSKSNKSILRSRAKNLCDVIDKLRVNAQHVNSDEVECSTPRSESMVDRKEMKSKDANKESRDLSVSKTSDNKSKYSSSDQFTVKQSSGSLKLTVTKTRSSESGSKSKYKQSSKNSSTVSSSSSSVKATSSSGTSSAPKSGNMSPASKKMYPPSVNVSKTSSSSSNPGKMNASNPQKTSSPSHHSSSMSPRSGIPLNNMAKSVSKHVSSSGQNKVSGSMSKVLDKVEKKSGELKAMTSEPKDKVTTSISNVVTSLMPPPPSSKQSYESSRSSSGNTPKRIDDSSRHTPTRELLGDEQEGDRAFRFLMGQSKIDSSTGAEQNTVSSKPEFIQSAIDYSKIDVLKKSDADDKSQWVSSSSDIKPSSIQRLKANPEPLSLDEINCIAMDLDCKPTVEVEVSSSSKHEMIVNANLVTSSEEISKSVAPLLSKPIKPPPSRTNRLSEEESSPEECLVIDYPDTPRVQMPIEEKWSSPRIDTNMLNTLDDKIDKSELSSGPYSVNQANLIKSPAQLIPPNHSLTRPLSIIDDDLMNEAVMPIEK